MCPSVLRLSEGDHRAWLALPNHVLCATQNPGLMELRVRLPSPRSPHLQAGLGHNLPRQTAGATGAGSVLLRLCLWNAPHSGCAGRGFELGSTHCVSAHFIFHVQTVTV